MIVKSYIESNLHRLDRLYRDTHSPKKAEFYSKLAVLEFGGWIEVTMDEIIARLGNRLIKTEPNRKHLAKQIIKTTYGFEYEKHFRKMLINVVGLAGVEKIESLVDDSKFQPMISALENLKKVRDAQAHQYLKKWDITRRLDAPSVIKIQLGLVHDGLANLDSVLRSIKSPLSF